MAVTSNEKLPDHQLARLSGHTGAVHALTYSSGTGQYILSGSSDRTIKLWNPAKAVLSTSAPQSNSITTKRNATNVNSSAGLVQSYANAHGYEVLSVSVSSDNARFVSSGGDKTVFLWDVATATTLRRFSGHNGRVECVVFAGESDGVIVSGSYDASVRIWDTRSQTGKPLMSLNEAKDSVTSLAVVDAEIVAGSVDGRVRTYDLRMGGCYVDVIGQSVTSITPTRQGDSLLVSSLDSTLRLMDRSNGKLLQSYQDPGYVNTTYRVRSTLAVNDAIVLSGSEDGCIYAWDVLNGQMLRKLDHYVAQDGPNVKNSKKVVSAVAQKKRGEEWASASGDGTIVVWGHTP